MIKTRILIIIILFSAIKPIYLYSQFSLTIEITKLVNSNGHVFLEFSNGKSEKISGIIQTINNKKCTITIKNLKQGKYTFKYFHDENGNRKLDTNFIGIPKEGFGFSNNAKGKFGPPPVEKTIFYLSRDTTLTCAAIYL